MMRANTLASLDQAIRIEKQLNGFAVGHAGYQDAAGRLSARIQLGFLAQQYFFRRRELLVFGAKLCFAQCHRHDLTPAINPVGQVVYQLAGVSKMIQGGRRLCWLTAVREIDISKRRRALHGRAPTRG